MLADLGWAVQALAESLNQAYGTGAQVDAEGVLNLVMQDGRPGWSVLRPMASILGFLPPENMCKASELTQQVKAHIDQLNSRLPPEQHFSLNLAGHSLGGALATYSALQNQVPATVTCPMRLGWGARASLGREAMAAAPHLVTEVVVKGDWVSDNAASKAYGVLDVLSAGLTGSSGDNRGAIGQRFLVPRPSDEQLRMWADINYSDNLVDRDKKSPTLSPNLTFTATLTCVWSCSSTSTQPMRWAAAIKDCKPICWLLGDSCPIGRHWSTHPMKTTCPASVVASESGLR